MGMKNMGDYHDHYLKEDVLLLADVFEMFIDTCMKFYRLDPCHYFSVPRLSWDAMLKVTGVELEKTSDINKYLFIEKGVRGRIYDIAKRYDSKELSKFITDLDMNNLYGWAIKSYFSG